MSIRLSLRGIDLETRMIGPGAIAPQPICGTEAWQETGIVRLVSNGDPEWKGWAESWLTDAAEGRCLIVGANFPGFDLPVVHHWFPELRPLVWRVLDVGGVTDIMSCEKLLNLCEFGQVDHWYDESGKQHDFDYNLGALAQKYLGKDRSHQKRMSAKELKAQGLSEEMQDIWQLHFDSLDGVPSSRYPQDAADYVKEDAADPIAIRVRQEERAEAMRQRGARFPDGRPFDPFATESLHVSAKFALQLMTIKGIAVDAAEVERLKAAVQAELVPQKVAKLIFSKILEPAKPALPFANGARHGAADGGLVKVCDCAAPSHEPGTPKYAQAKNAKTSTTLLRQRVIETIERVNKEAGEDKVKLRRTPPSDTFPTDATLAEWDARAAEGCADSAKKAKNARSHNKAGEPNPKGGQVSTDAEVIADLAGFDVVLAEYDHWSGLQKMETNEIPRLERAVAEGCVMHPGFDDIKKTLRPASRASSKFASTNIYQIARGFRVKHDTCEGCIGEECERCGGLQKWESKIEPRNAYVAREGKVLLSTDYATIELACAAQQVYREVGYSVMRDWINRGADLHSWFAGLLQCRTDAAFVARCSATIGAEKTGDPDAVYRYFLTLKKGTAEEKDYYDKWRQFAKSPNLALPGGMGARTLVSYAMKTFGVRFESMDQAKSVKDFWMDTFAEFPDYFDRIKWKFKDDIHSREGRDERGWDRTKYAYWTPLGVYRANCFFTECANGFSMQSPAAEGFKIALAELSRACYDPTMGSCLYGCDLLAGIYDEFIIEIPDDQWIHERAAEVERIMIRCMRIICPDVLVKAEPTPMYRWSKGASYRLDQNGRLMIWEKWLEQEAKRKAIAKADKALKRQMAKVG